MSSASSKPGGFLSNLFVGMPSEPVPATETRREVVGPTGEIYFTYNLVGQDKVYKLYSCLFPSGACGILKIATSKEYNFDLEREASFLRFMSEQAEEMDADLPVMRKIRYQYFFPALVESFVSADQGGRRISILGFPEMVSELTRLTPLASLVEKERIRVDPHTSAWILGKALKMLVFANFLGISCGNLSALNILIDREEHGVYLFDWSKADKVNDDIPQEIVNRDLSQLGRTIVVILGGNPDTGELLPSEQFKGTIAYADHLRHLVLGRYSGAREAWKKHYEIVESLWGKPRPFYPYTAIRLDEPQDSERSS